MKNSETSCIEQRSDLLHGRVQASSPNLSLIFIFYSQVHVCSSLFTNLLSILLQFKYCFVPLFGQHQNSTLCHTMACFHVISISLIISSGDHPCAHYLHYFYVACLIMTSQLLMTLLGMLHCGITMGNDFTKDIHCNVTMDNYVTMCT